MPNDSTPVYRQTNPLTTNIYDVIVTGPCLCGEEQQRKALKTQHCEIKHGDNSTSNTLST